MTLPLTPQQRPEHWMKGWWNGEPAQVRRVVVRVAAPPTQRDASWYRPLVGQERDAVEVQYAGQRFFLDDGPWTAVLEAHHRAMREQSPRLAALERAAGADPDRPTPGAGIGWWKVTEGRGGPDCYHRSLDRAVLLREREEREP